MMTGSESSSLVRQDEEASEMTVPESQRLVISSTKKGPSLDPAFQKLRLPADLLKLLSEAQSVTLFRSAREILETTAPNCDSSCEVGYVVPEKGFVLEATVCRTRNGLAANYAEAYMRRRDPDCMFVGDSLPTDKPRFNEVFKVPFDTVRAESFAWLREQHLAVFLFYAGRRDMGTVSMVVAPSNAAFFAFGLSLLQGIVSPEELPEGKPPQAFVFVVPPFRHTHFSGKQVVVHNRLPQRHELFSYNLYPGPSAKKGIYGVLLSQGEREDWITAHCSAVRVTTPYDNQLHIMHEGASGGGKSELLESVHRERDGRLLLGVNIATGENRYIILPSACALNPVADDMALCHPSLQRNDGKLAIEDAEDAWFVRVNHIKHYGTDPDLEEVTTRPNEPFLFLNITARPGATALIWEHIMDTPKQACPNPRVVIPRAIIPGVIQGPVTIDVRSFGVRTPPCTEAAPTYGVLGMLHLLPPSIAWLWRLVAPRGHDNPSIVASNRLEAEGVGSYWPFAIGRKVDQANLLLRQIVNTPKVRYVLCPNQHIGAWRVGFMPQWIMREFLSRRGGAKFRYDQVERSESDPLLGYTPKQVVVEGQSIPSMMLRIALQRDVGEAAFLKGVKELRDFFVTELESFLLADLDPLGKKIICSYIEGRPIDELEELIPHPMFD
jgi:hypothetical protein